MEYRLVWCTTLWQVVFHGTQAPSVEYTAEVTPACLVTQGVFHNTAASPASTTDPALSGLNAYLQPVVWGCNALPANCYFALTQQLVV